MLEGFLGIVQIEFLALKHVFDIKLAVAMVISVIDNQVGIAEVGHTGNDTIAHFFPVLLGDYPFVTVFLEEVEIKVLDEIFGQIVTQESDIVVKFAYFEYLLVAHSWLTPEIFLLLFRWIIPASLNIFEHFEAKVIGIE